jgi:hypothetical protein
VLLERLAWPLVLQQRLGSWLGGRFRSGRFGRWLGGWFGSSSFGNWLGGGFAAAGLALV